MRKLVYPLVAALCFYASSSCYAQTPAEMANATKQYKAFTSHYPTLKKNLDASLKQAKAAQKNGPQFDNTSYKVYKEVLQEQYDNDASPIIELQTKYPMVRGHGNKDLQTWRTDIDGKYKILTDLVNSIDDIVRKLKPSQLTANREPENVPVAAHVT
jgi:hypothetical protein